MKEKQIIQFNNMLFTLRKIAKNYQTPTQLRKCQGQIGLDYEEELEMAYENIQSEAARASKGIKEIKKSDSQLNEQQQSHSGTIASSQASPADDGTKKD
jgi:predicted nuclease with TOPRIM domain